MPLYLGQHKSELRSVSIDWKILNIRITALESRRLKHRLEKGVKALYLQSTVVAAILSDPSSCGPLKFLSSIPQVRPGIFARRSPEAKSLAQPLPLRDRPSEGISSLLLTPGLLSFLTAAAGPRPHQSGAVSWMASISPKCRSSYSPRTRTRSSLSTLLKLCSRHTTNTTLMEAT